MSLFKNVSLSQAVVAQLRAISIEDQTSRKAYKKEKKQYVASYCTEAKLVDLHVYIGEYAMKMQENIDESMRLVEPFLDEHGLVPKPVLAKTATAQERALAYAPYNEFKSIDKYRIAHYAAESLAERFNMKMFKKLIDKLLESYLTSIKTKYAGDFIINTLNDSVAYMFGFDDPIIGGQLIDIIVEAGLAKRRKMSTSGDSKHKQFMMHVLFEGVEDLYVTKTLTDRYSARLALPALVDEDSFIISQQTWRYEQKKNSPRLIKTINKLNRTAVSFADWVTEDHIAQAIIEKLDSDAAWVAIEVELAVMEFRRIKENGNKFYIEHFIDGATRIYEYKSHFGFQEGKGLRCMLRFYNKKPVTAKGQAVYLQSIKAEYGHIDLEKILDEHGDKWGWIDAVQHPKVPTGSVAYRDATNQVVGLYGLVTGDELLMTLGGFTTMLEEEFVKAYILYSDKMNTRLGVFYTLQIAKEVYAEAFDNENVKNAVMTSLYNVSVERVLTGYGYNPESEDEEDFEIVEVRGEYETSKSKLGKLVPLLKTAREFEQVFNASNPSLPNIHITKEQLGELHIKTIREVLYVALKTLAKINSVVKNIENLTLVEWDHYDGTHNQYAMVNTKVIHVPWITVKGANHSFKHHIKVLESGVKWRGVPPRKIQSYDSGLMRGMVCNAVDKDYDIAGIHDSAGTHGNDMEDTTEAYIEDCVTLAMYDPLTKDLNKISGKEFVSLHSGRSLKDIEKQIRTANLAFIA